MAITLTDIDGHLILANSKQNSSKPVDEWKLEVQEQLEGFICVMYNQCL